MKSAVTFAEAQGSGGVPVARPRTALLVDDDIVLCAAMARDFRAAGWSVRTANDYHGALVEVAASAPDLAVIDLGMPGPSGMDLLVALREAAPDTRTIVLTGYCSVDAAVDAMRLGAIDFLTKPARYDEVLAALARVEAAAPPPGDGPTLAAAERHHIDKVMDDCGGNVSRAARVLGIHRRSLQRKLRRSE